MRFPDIRLPKLKFHRGGDDWSTYNAMDPTRKYQYRDVYKNQQLERADEVLPETMTSRIIALVILSILVAILAWYGFGLLQFVGGAFSGSVSNATSSNSPVVSTETGQPGESGQDDLSRFEQDDTPVEPKSLAEFRKIQGMDFDTYKASYYELVSAENAGLHWYKSSLTGDTYQWSDIYKLWEEITKNNYAAYMAMYNGSSDTGWQNGSSDNYILADTGASSGDTSAPETPDGVGGLTIGGVSLRECMGKITFWKVFFTLLAVLLTWVIVYPVMERNLAVQNQGKDNRHLLQYPNDQHIQMPEEMQLHYDYFPDVGAHSPVQVSSMISHVMLLNKNVKKVNVVRRAASDIRSESSGDILYLEGEVLLDEDGEPIVDNLPMFDKKFGIALFDSASVLDDHRARVFYNPSVIAYNPENKNRDKLKNAKTVSEMINKYWSFPEYEPQRPAGAYLVDTAPVNTMI